MEATINREGKLQVAATNGLEAYALEKWWDDFNKNKTTLKIITDRDPPKALVIHSLKH